MPCTRRDSLLREFETPGDLDVKLCEYVKRDEKSIDIYLSILYELIYHLFSSQREDHQDERVRERFGHKPICSLLCFYSVVLNS